jgi:lactate racemase
MERTMVSGDTTVRVTLPDHTHVVSPGVTLPLEATADLHATVQQALEHPLDRPPLRAQVRPGSKVTVAFDDPTVPCYAPVWATAIPAIVAELERAGVRRSDVSLLCANALHRQWTHDELASLLGDELVREHHDRLSCHDAEDPDGIVDVGHTASGYDVQLNRSVLDSDLTIYLNCSTMRGFSGGWKSVCVGLSGYRSIRHHHTPDVMSMSFDRNRMHAMLDEMGALVEREFGPERIFKIETVLANPFVVHDMYGGSVAATRARVLAILKEHQRPRRDLLEEPADIVVYGVPDWSPYAAFSHTNPILDLISTGLGYLGGMIEAVGKPGCTVVLATPCPYRWNQVHHPSYQEVWHEVLPSTLDPDEARNVYEPALAERKDYVRKYRYEFGFHPVHAVMALYPLKRLRHAGRVIIAGPDDAAVPRHCGFEVAETVEKAISMAEDVHGTGASIAFVDYPIAVNRS